MLQRLERLTNELMAGFQIGGTLIEHGRHTSYAA
jgi:hypothetical protein